MYLMNYTNCQVHCCVHIVGSYFQISSSSALTSIQLMSYYLSSFRAAVEYVMQILQVHVSLQ